VPRNFDELLQEDLTFILGGETFTMQYVRPEIMAAWEDEPDIETAVETIEEADAKVKLFLLPGDAKRYEELRAREDKPVTSQQLNELLRWMVEVQTGRPTRRASDLEPGPGSTEATSTDASPAQGETPSPRRVMAPPRKRPARRR